jgi:hypothetical protein
MCLIQGCAVGVNKPAVSRFYKFISWIFLPLGLVVLSLATPRGEFVFALGLTPSPTVDRLAKPTMPLNPSQADRGAQDYWLYCSPCHGDRGQGLTDEFRKVYPPEDQDCWLSGCHGRRPYPNGWTIPTPVPALIGPGAINKFGNGSVLWFFIKTKMPFQKPGSLDDDTYWRLTAFLLRQNGYWSGDGVLDENSAAIVKTGAGQSITASPVPTVLPTDPPATHTPDATDPFSTRLAAAFGLLILIIIFLFFVLHEKRRNREL